ncbi:gamma-glutamyl-gamma-aminobutyrate hydrolase family protein [Streptomyces kunmingensis]|uniref:Gamma-glutamyl-gamma-aminobutyrate hydrolase family protein n=1 Tax=Streptomyces kunmingensis TaxID=68225 RepID=A0ABU6CR31_9ACTN|nr:gamma-glutamyl-gamma-aminobutyrate hydrolase family protein [Streptomyces kunmingensis]MEB3967210.1 gamma-glutamyl-gamma-aminobutyrate hydrolase family protein [Streptomyces kunmingensis]
MPARFSAVSSCLPEPGEVNARALIASVWRAGGEPATLHPYAPEGTADPEDVRARLARFDGLLLPGGGDIAPHRYGAGRTHRTVYDVDDEQDAFDLEAARQALACGVPLLAICRGLQVVNTALGGTLHQDMNGADGSGQGHRHLRQSVSFASRSALARITGTDKAEASCYHHQHVDRPGKGLRVTARAADATVEALELTGDGGWFLAVQWHPEDTAHEDLVQQRLFDALVDAARSV